MDPFVVYADANAITGNELILNLGDQQPIGLMQFTCKDRELAWKLYCKQLKITIEIQDPPINPADHNS